MKILILSNDGGGLYNFRGELIKELLINHEVYISLPKSKYVDKLTNMGCKFTPCNLERHGVNPFNEIKLLLYYKKILSEYRPDIVFTYTIKPNIYGGMMCEKKNIPYVCNITGLGMALENEGITQKVMLILYKIALRKAQKVFFQNSENREFMLKNQVVKGRYDLLPGSGVNLERYRVLDYPESETVDFVFIGRIMKEKGIDQYVEAAEYIRKKYPNTRFHVCGAYEQNYEERIKKLHEDRVIIYHGLVENIIDIHRISQCTIHPSYYPEGMSNVLLESCACGRPIITTDKNGCREIVENGINGYMVKQKDSKDLIYKIEKFLKLSVNERKKMGLAGRKKVENQFDRNIVVQKYMQELNNIHRI